MELLKAIILNTLKLKNTAYLHFGFEIDNLNYEKIMYDGYYHQIFDAKTILEPLISLKYLWAWIVFNGTLDKFITHNTKQQSC